MATKPTQGAKPPPPPAAAPTPAPGQKADLGENKGTVDNAQKTASQDMAASDALAAIARQVSLNDAKNALFKKGGDALKGGI
jgi:hypothetical protein